uniref:Uncharacterized protein n=1 Tax=Stomoxys calcitrans TaxID=35570 RepID=A0A1I8Q1R4_STOCA
MILIEDNGQMENKSKRFLNSRLDLPLYMVSRNRLKLPPIYEKLQNHIKRKGTLYTSNECQEATKNLEPFSECIYYDNLNENLSRNSKTCKTPNKSHISSEDKSWSLPSNRYDLKTPPFESRTGSKGAYWRKTAQTIPRKTVVRKSISQFYDIPKEMEKLKNRYNAFKGKFLSNPRERRATTRAMICNPLTSYKDPMEPAPNTYRPKVIGKTCKSPKACEPPNPHLFLRHSVVPVKSNSIHPKHTSFLPGPGRYETRYFKICPCDGKQKKYQPNLDMLVEREKRMKFRGKPFTKIKTQLYCSPDWRHVRGYGFRRLFRGSIGPQKQTVKASEEAKGKSESVKLFHNAKYLDMILNPNHESLSFRKDPLTQLPPRITFNRMVKVVTRKQLRSNRKFAFGSSTERWQDDERPAVATPQQIREMLKQIPEDRRIHNKPIMQKKPEEIVSKLGQTPKHMLPNYVPNLRRRLFKFSPLPNAKILTNETDIRPMEPATHGYFFQPLDGRKYFKDDI